MPYMAKETVLAMVTACTTALLRCRRPTMVVLLHILALCAKLLQQVPRKRLMLRSSMMVY